jgi:iron(III) transport system permease protein
VAVAALVALAFAAPLAFLLSHNVTRGAALVDTLASRRTLEPLSRTLLLATTVAAAAAVVGTALAWLATRTDLPGRRAVRVLAPLPLVMPSFVGATSLLAAFARGGLVDEVLGVDRLPTVDGYWGAFWVLTLFTYPYVYLPVAARLGGLPPSLEESARLLGARPWQMFRTVVLPQVSGAVWAGALLVFLYAVSDFGAVQLLRYDTLTREIYASRLLDRDLSLALGLILALVALAVVAGERAVGRRRPVTAAPGARRSLQVPLGRWRWPAFGLVVVVLGNALAAPMSVLAYWAGRGGGLADDLDELVTPALNTSLIGVVTAAVAVATVLPVAYLTGRHRTRVGGPANALVVGGFALPGLVIALAVVSWVVQAPLVGGLYQTLPLLVLTYVVHFGAQAMRSSQVAVGGVPPRMDDAARMLGAGRARRLLTIDLPLMLPGLLAGAGLVLLSTMKELPATLLLAPTGFTTLATRIWSRTEDGFLAEAGLASLVLIVLSGLLTWLLVVRRAERFG